MIRKFFVFLLMTVLAGLLLTWGAIQHLETWSRRPQSVAVEALVELRPRLSLDQLSASLQEKGLVDDSRMFHLWMKLEGGYGQFQAGTYQFIGPVTPAMIRDKMMRGSIFIPNVVQVIIPEGFTLRMLNERLATKGIGKLSELTKLVRDPKFLKDLGVKSTSLEGYTYPATYSFEKIPTPREFYSRVVHTFFDKLPLDYEEQALALGLSLNKAVTFASLIELETMLDEEKPMISEVIWSRLKKGDTLGIDAAVIYGIPNYQGDIKWEHLKDTKNPYNTRVHRGLPPTAIGAVSKTSLVAVLNPTNLGYYYYMLDAEDRTRHVFSRTGAEHNIQVQKFLRSQKSQGFKKPAK